MLTVPVRALAVLAAAVTLTVPLPAPLAPEEIVSHGVPLLAVQVQPDAAVTVTFDPEICQHTGICLRGLPNVFDVKEKRWIRPELATSEEVIAQVGRCPSGALQIRK